MTKSKIIQLHNRAADAASRMVEQRARQILQAHPNLDEFIMGMGAAFFTRKGGRQTTIRRTNIMKHNYFDSAESLPSLITRAADEWQKLSVTLCAIQDITGIPGLRTDINTDDSTPGVLERIQYMVEGPVPFSPEKALDIFKEFDATEV